MRISLLALACAAGLAVTPVIAAPPLNPGMSAPLTSSTGFIGRTVVDSKGKVIGTVESLKTSADLIKVDEVLVKTATETISLTPAQLATEDSGQLVAQGVTAGDAAKLPAAKATGEERGGLLGQTVYSLDKKGLGTVDNLILQDRTGLILSVLINAGKKDQFVALERSTIMRDEGGTIVAKLTAAEFEALPGTGGDAKGGLTASQ